MKPDRSSIRPSVVSHIEYLERRIAEARSARRAALSPSYLAVIAQLPEVDTNIYGTDPYWLSLSMFTPAFTFEDAPDLFQALETLTDLFGFPTTSDKPELECREYLFEAREPWRVTLRAYLLPDGVSKRVCVGVR